MPQFKRNLILAAVLFGLAFTFNGCKPKGCTDPLAVNYDADAKRDNDNCVYQPFGSMHIHFHHEVDGQDLVNDNIQYTNAAGNPYSIITLKYFISDIQFNKSDGSSFLVDKEKYVDAFDGATTSYDIDTITDGDYESISFIFGLNETKNVAGRYVNPPESNMEWPTPMGPGYHYMKLEGKFDSSGTIKNYNVHTGASMGNPFFVEVTLPSSAISIAHNHHEMDITMNINEWFNNPNVYDFNAFGPMIMGNPNAQTLLKANGSSVFEAEIQLADPHGD